MAKVILHTGPGVFEVLAHVCRSPQEAMKQFVENAADAIETAATDEGQIQIKLTYKATGKDTAGRLLKSISVQDNGIGMTSQKMQQVLHQIGSSEKLNSALRG
jgi:HSP90 family molecular chaperone